MEKTVVIEMAPTAAGKEAAAPVARVRIGGLGSAGAEPSAALISTGARRTSVEAGLAKRLGLNADCTEGTARAWIEIEGLDWPRRRVEIEVRKGNRGHEVVIGMDLLAELTLRYDGKRRQMELKLNG